MVIGAVVGGLISAATAAYDSYQKSGSVDWTSVAISGAVGAVSGGIAATGLGVFAQAGWTAAATGIGTAVSETYNEVKQSGWGSFDGKKVGTILLKSTASAAIGFGNSIIGSAAGKVVSNNLKESGEALIKRNFNIGCFTRAQAKNMIKQGKAMVNTSYGISSVVGTLFTWPTSTSLIDAVT